MDTSTPDELLPGRRRFLGACATSTFGCAVALGGVGCTALPRAPERLAEDLDLEAFLERLERGLAELDHQPLLGPTVEAILGPERIDWSAPDLAARAAQVEAFERRVLRALLIAGVAHDLPAEVRGSDELLGALSRYDVELEETLVEICRALEGCSEVEQIRYLQALWDRIVEQPGELPVPESHLVLAEQRLAEYRHDPARARSAFEIIDRLSQKKR